MNDVIYRPNEMDRLRVAPEYVRSVAVDVILTICLCGLWNIWVQARQMRAVNFMLGHRKYVFLHWALLTLFTCGLWHIYHEYRLSRDIAWARNTPNADSPVVHLVLSIFGFSIIVDALQQSEINSYFGNNSL